MRKFQFRLASVARLREAVRDQRRGELADAVGVQNSLEQQIGRVDRDLVEARLLQTAPVGKVDVDRLLNGERYELLLQAERGSLVQQLTKVAVEVAKRREALVAADQDVKALEKLRASQHEDWRQQSEREISRELDEVAGRTAAGRENPMIGKLFARIGWLVSSACIATVLALTLLAGFCWWRGVIDGDRLADLAAVFDGSASAERPESKIIDLHDRANQPSLVDIARARAIKSRDFELREQMLHSQWDELKDERVKLTGEIDRYNRVKTALDRQLDTLRAATISNSQETTRLILETMKPKQAKEQVLRMVDEGSMPEVVALLSAMTPTKRAKVIGEFKTPDEVDKLAEILKVIRDGEPELSLIEGAKTQLQPAAPGQ